MRADLIDPLSLAAAQADIHGGVGFEKHKTAIR